MHGEEMMPEMLPKEALPDQRTLIVAQKGVTL
jgi:hypothetical protein